MPSQFTRGDSLREFLTGAASDGATQNDFALSLGGFRSSRQAASLGITLDNAIAGVRVDFASGGNPEGQGDILAVGDTLAWKIAGEFGSAVTFSGTQTNILEGDTPGKFLRVTGTPPFSQGRGNVTLSPLVHGLLGFAEVSPAIATSGGNKYRASIVKNVSAVTVTAFKRWITPLAASVVGDVTALGASGAGTLETTGTFAAWPTSGWCQVRQSGGALRECVYYDERTVTELNVIARGAFGTTPGAGALTDILYPVPGVVLGLDTAGVTAPGAIATIPNETTAPAGVTWVLGINSAGAVAHATITAGQQFGVWYWQNIPAGCKGTPLARVSFTTEFTVP